MLKSLLLNGYLPKELPPPFTTESFAKKSREITHEFANLTAIMTAKERERHPRPSQPGKFDMARRGHSRRMLSIVNPVNQLYLCDLLVNKWKEIEVAMGASAYSITRADITAGSTRAVPLPPFATLPERRIKLYAPYSHIVETDVSAFYHAIYTHSIPWALHEKELAKSRRR